MDLRSVDFGRDTAEFDQHLSEYFLETPTFQLVVDGQRSIVIGRKGTGKTALVKYMSEGERPSHEYILKIESSHATYVKIDENLRSFVSQVKNLDSSFKLGWLFTVVLALVERFTKETTLAVTKEERDLHKFALANLGYDPADPISAIAGYVTSWIKNLKSLGPAHRASPAAREPSLDEPRLLQLIVGAVDRVTKKGKRVYFLFDRLDERWDGSELYANFLQGLLLAIKDLRANCPRVCPVVFLRDDIFDEVTKGFQHIDHYRMEIEQIRWDERSLLEMAALRIASSMRRKGDRFADGDAVALWRVVFPEDVPFKKNPIPSHAYMIERTLSRPRDIILFATKARDVALARRNSHVTAKDLTHAETDYSQTKLKDLFAECSYRYPGLDQVVQRFRRKTAGFDRDELRMLLLEIAEEVGPQVGWIPTNEIEFMKDLYSIGFLSYTTKGGILRGTRVVHSGINADPNVILEQARVFVSPIFRKALELRDH